MEILLEEKRESEPSGLAIRQKCIRKIQAVPKLGKGAQEFDRINLTQKENCRKLDPHGGMHDYGLGKR